MRILIVAMLVLGVFAAPASAGWTRPSVVLNGDGPVLLASSVRADGALLEAVSQGDAFGYQGAVLHVPRMVAQVAFAADGSGIALQVARHQPSSVIAFSTDGSAAPPVVLDDVGSETAVAISPGGAAVAAWVAKTAAGYEVDAAFRDPGSAAFGAPVRAGYTTSADTLVDAGIGDRGEAVVTWQENGFPSRLAAAVRLPGAGFSPARFVTGNATDAHLAVGPGGQAIVAYAVGSGVDASIKPPGAAAMPPPRRLARAALSGGVAVAAAGARRVALAWLTGSTRRVRVYEGANSLRRVATLGRDADGEEPGLAIDGTGAAVVSWEEALKAKPGDATARSHFAAAYRPAGRHFEPARDFGPVTLDSSPVSAAIGPGGRAYVFYEAFKTSDTRGGGFRRVYVTEHMP